MLIHSKEDLTMGLLSCEYLKLETMRSSDGLDTWDEREGQGKNCMNS